MSLPHAAFPVSTPLRPHAISRAVALALLSLGLLPLAAQAQHSRAAQNDSAARDDAHTLPAIHAAGQRDDASSEETGGYTVKRSRSATSLSISPRETPQSVTVVTRERLDDQAASSLADAMESVTGISVSTTDSRGSSFSVRGFDVDNVQIDGVPMLWAGSWSAGESRSASIIHDRIEVVRGATGLLTGSGEPAAAINQIRKRASSRELTGNVGLGIGSWSHRNLSADVSNKLNESGTVRGRLVAEHEAGDSFIDLEKKKRSTLYGVIDADLTPDTTLSVGASYQRDKPSGGMWGTLPALFDDGSITDFSRSQTTAPSWATWGSKQQTVFASLTHNLDTWKLRADLTRIEREADLRLLYVYGNPNRATGLGMQTRGPNWYDTRDKQTNIHLAASRPFHLLDREHELGFGFSRNTRDFSALGRTAQNAETTLASLYGWNGSYPFPTAWSDASTSAASQTTQTAFYGVTRLQITEPLKLILGARITDYQQDVAATQWASAYTMKYDREITPYAGITYDITPDLTGYVSYTSIFNPQNAIDRTGSPLDPVVGKSYEAGLKADLLDDKVQASLAVFRIQQDNLAVRDGTSTVPGTTDPAYRAIDGTKSQGYEIELSGEPMRDLKVWLGWSQFKAEDADGEIVNPEQPRKLLKLGASYKLPADLNAFTIGGSLNWKGSYYTDLTHPVAEADVRLEQPAYTLLNLMAKYEISRHWEAQLNIDNVFDKKYRSAVGFFNGYTWGQPRRFLLSAKYRF